MIYEYLKAFHLIAVMSWMAGLLYLPRLFVYHAGVEPGSLRAETFKLMERRLLKFIMNPAMLASWFFGVWMLMLNPSLFIEIWFLVKALCICAMTASHMMFARMRKALEGDHSHAPKTYRFWNEVPTILMIIIIIMAVTKPQF